MANRFWVGGSATWDGTAGSKWATTSGGASGAAVPTAADDVFLDANSGANTVTTSSTSVCRSIVCTGFTGTLSLANSATALTVGDASGGALTFVSGMTLTIGGTTTLIVFASTSTNGGTGWTITSGGKTMPSHSFTGSGGKWVYGDAITCTATTSTITLTRGTLDTASKTISCGLFNSNNSNTRTLTLGSSAWTLNGGATGGHPIIIATTGLTITANTASFTVSANNADVNSQSATLDFNGASITFTGNQNANGGFQSSAATITMANLTYNGTAIQTNQFTLNNTNIVVTSALTLSGSSRANQLLVATNLVGLSRTITCNGTVTLTNVDFQDITGAGSASWNFSGQTNIGDAWGNSGITFPTGITCYFKAPTAGGGVNWSAANWYTTSGGATPARLPLCHDTARVDANSVITTGILGIDIPRACRDLDCTGSGFTGVGGMSTSLGTINILGSVTLKSGMAAWAGGASNTVLGGRSTHTITSAGVTLGNSTGWTLTVTAPGGSYTMQDAMSVSGPFIHTAGTFDTGSFSVSALSLTSNSGSTRTLTLGSTTWTLSTGGVTITSSGLTMTAASSTIVLSSASASTRTFAGGGLTYGVVTYTVAGSTGQLTVTGANTFTTINFSDASNARTLLLPASTTTTVSNFNVTGTAGNLMTVKSSTGGTAATLATSAGATMPYASVQDITATPANAVYALDSTNVSGNTGIWFDPPDQLPHDNRSESRDFRPVGVTRAVHRAGRW